MDPFTIAATCGTVVSKTGSLAISITHFLSDVRDTKDDIDLVLRELASVQLCLAALSSRGQHQGLDLPEEMRQQIGQILVNIDFIVTKMEEQIRKLGSYSLKRKMQWAFSKKEDIIKFRTSLEAYKTALEVALTTHTIAMLTQLTADNAAEKDSLDQVVERIELVSLTAHNMDQKLDTVISLQKDDTKTALIASEIVRLRQELAVLSQNHTMQKATQTIAKQSWVYTRSVTQALHNELPLEPSFEPPRAGTVEARSDIRENLTPKKQDDGLHSVRIAAMTAERDTLLKKNHDIEKNLQETLSARAEATIMLQKEKEEHEYLRKEYGEILNDLEKARADLFGWQAYADGIRYDLEKEAYATKKKHKEDIEQLQSKHAEDIDQLRLQHHEQAYETQRKYNEYIAQLQQKYEATITTTQSQHDKYVNQVRKDYESKLLAASRQVKSMPLGIGVSPKASNPSQIAPIVQILMGTMYNDVSLDLKVFFTAHMANEHGLLLPSVETTAKSIFRTVLSLHNSNCELGSGSSYVQLWDGLGTKLKLADIRNYLLTIFRPLLQWCTYGDDRLVLLAKGYAMRKSLVSSQLSDFKEGPSFYLALTPEPNCNLASTEMVPDYQQTCEGLSPEEVLSNST